MDPQHRMGQPTPLLTGNLLGHGRVDRGFSRTPRQPEFMRAGLFATAMRYYLRTQSHFRVPDSLVENIVRLPSRQYRVYFCEGRQKFYMDVDNVIIAMGTGPSRALMAGEDGTLEVNVSGMRGYVVGGNQFLSPTWTMPSGDCRGKDVAVYGGSATAAWAVEMAEMRGMNVVCWFTRPDDRTGNWDTASRFRDAFPAGGRNSQLEQDYRGVRVVRRLTKVKFFAQAEFIGLTFRNQANEEVRLAVDLLVYALGAEHTRNAGVRRMLDQAIQDQLVAFYDRNLAISARPSLLAVGTPDSSLMIVGSAMSSSAGFGGGELRLQGDPTQRLSTLARYADISNTLPPSARPTEGIAMVMASVEALNEYIPARVARNARVVTYNAPFITREGRYNPDFGHKQHVVDFEWDINYNTSNRTQLAVYLAQTTDLNPFAANLAVALIVHLRTRAQNVSGLSDPQVQLIIAVADAYVRHRRATDPNLELTRYLNDRLLGADRFITLCVDAMTTDHAWVTYWRRYSINC
jgi:thioredoxin reductase